jgi:hypothetical protein
MTSRYEGRELLRRDLRQPADYFANPAFKRTPNGRPRNGIMLIFTIARPAVWRRLTR